MQAYSQKKETHASLNNIDIYSTSSPPMVKVCSCLSTILFNFSFPITLTTNSIVDIAQTIQEPQLLLHKLPIKMHIILSTIIQILITVLYILFIIVKYQLLNNEFLRLGGIYAPNLFILFTQSRKVQCTIYMHTNCFVSLFRLMSMYNQYIRRMLHLGHIFSYLS